MSRSRTSTPTFWPETGMGLFPTTRYQGSKRKLTGELLRHLGDLGGVRVLDAFGGTGAVAHAFKCAGACVTYNDILAFNHQIGVALIENDHVRLGDEVITNLERRRRNGDYDDFIERTFDGVYYTREENRWLDTVVQNISHLPCRFQRALAWFAVFQSAMIKRPYNLFHRSNLSMRLAKVSRSFGNKATWETPFPVCLRRFARQANDAIIDGGGSCRAVCGDANKVTGEFDLVYVDTPYIKRNGSGVDYLNFYHFLEGMVDYRNWATRIDFTRKHRPLRGDATNRWSCQAAIHNAFEELFVRFSSCVLCVSYRSDGTPSIDDLAALLRRFKRRVEVIVLAEYRYALSPDRNIRETLLIGR